MKGKLKKDVLIALMNNQRDFRLAQEQRWYRIPVKSAPEIVRDGGLRYLAFYHTKVFAEQAFSVRWYGEVQRLTVVRRRELFPDLQGDPKAEQEYYKIAFDELQQLSEPILSRRLRRVLFISTTFQRFQQAREINDLFHESPLEELLWERFRAERIEAERQYLVGAGSRFFYLDFALFCKERNLDIECDGDEFHSKLADVKRDKRRNNLLESLGWAVLRFTTEDLRQRLAEVISQTKATINRYGGLERASEPGVFRRLATGPGQQLSLFE
jgi:very-short-patch-repair endonuclease